ncbi:hypothetical protein WME98_04885 [Sorangium sp. So ce296]|uniref:hypothetical protein n=1 Tax=Sorangium sp. So ce296 TaxID=3133296 RepID=UPI003F5EB596
MKQLIVPGTIALSVLTAACDRIPLDPIRGDDAGGDAAGEGGAGSGSAGSGSGAGSGSSAGNGSSAGSGGAPGTGDSLWSLHFGSTVRQASVSGGRIAVDGAGHVILAIEVAEGVDLGDGPLSTEGRSDVSLAKFGGEGQLIWHKRLFDAGYVQDVAVNPAGLIALAGRARQTSIDLGGGPLVGGSLDAFVAVFTADGEHVWSARSGAGSYVVWDSIDVDAAGNVVVAVSFTGQISLCGRSLTSATVDDSYVAKFDPAGHCLWVKQLGATETHDVALDATGNVALAGSFGYGDMKTIDLGGGPLTSAGREDVFVAKLDAAGAHLWSKRFGDEALQRAYGVAVDGSGAVVIGGTFLGSVDFGGGALVSAGGFDFLEPGSVTWGGNMFVTRFGPAGELLWAKRFGEYGPQTALDVAANVGGDIAITGLLYGDVDLGTGLMDCTYGDAFAAKLDATGTVRWAKHTGDRGRQYGQSTAIDATGSVFAAGPFLGTIDFGTGPLVNAPSEPSSDSFLVKFGP